VILAILLTFLITGSGAKHRKQDGVILQVHGAAPRQIITLEALEAFAVGICGAIAGIILAFIAIKMFIHIDLTRDKNTILWTLISSLAGLSIAMITILLPTWKQLKNTNVKASKSIRSSVKPLWQKVYLDVFLLGISLIEYLRISSTGFKVVLAPEGIASVSVNYESFISPLCLWLGGVLLAIRFVDFCLNKGRNVIAKVIGPVSGKLSKIVASSLSRERVFLIRGIILVAMALSFAVSTSIFNTTYNAQSRVDA
jgi:putative ABC transport system permease protein